MWPILTGFFQDAPYSPNFQFSQLPLTTESSAKILLPKNCAQRIFYYRRKVDQLPWLISLIRSHIGALKCTSYFTTLRGGHTQWPWSGNTIFIEATRDRAKRDRASWTIYFLTPFGHTNGMPFGHMSGRAFVNPVSVSSMEVVVILNRFVWNFHHSTIRPRRKAHHGLFFDICIADLTRDEKVSP